MQEATGSSAISFENKPEGKIEFKNIQINDYVNLYDYYNFFANDYNYFLLGFDRSPDPGDYLVRVHVKKDGDWSWEKVHMDYVSPKKK